MSWRVTHMDMRHRRHCLVLECATGAQAAALAEALYGAALYLATMRIRATDPPLVRPPVRPLFRPVGAAQRSAGGSI